MDNKTQDIQYLQKNNNLKSKLSWEEVFKIMAQIPSDDIFPEGRKELPPQERNWELFNK